MLPQISRSMSELKRAMPGRTRENRSVYCSKTPTSQPSALTKLLELTVSLQTASNATREVITRCTRSFHHRILIVNENVPLGGTLAVPWINVQETN